MKKIMFNDRYVLTEAVLEGRKTQTRRLSGFYDQTMNPHLTLLLRSEKGREEFVAKNSKYKIGEVVAIAQAYRDTKATRNFVEDAEFIDKTKNTAGWRNKMFVKAELMPSHVKITNIRVERLQDISDEDCLKEGIIEAERDALGRYVTRYGFEDTKNPYGHYFNTPREAFAHLIDKVGKKGTWDSNPYVFVYDFELVDRRNDYDNTRTCKGICRG